MISNGESIVGTATGCISGLGVASETGIIQVVGGFGDGSHPSPRQSSTRKENSSSGFVANPDRSRARKEPMNGKVKSEVFTAVFIVVSIVCVTVGLRIGDEVYFFLGVLGLPGMAGSRSECYARSDPPGIPSA